MPIDSECEEECPSGGEHDWEEIMFSGKNYQYWATEYGRSCRKCFRIEPVYWENTP